MEADWQCVDVGFEVDLAREAIPQVSKRLVALPLAPVAETCARATVPSNICIKCAVVLS